MILQLAIGLCLISCVSVYGAGKLTINMDGKVTQAAADGSVSVPASVKSVTFRYDADWKTASPARLRYRLDGIDEQWRDGGGEMLLAVRFLDASGDQLRQVPFLATGVSAGWGGSLAQSIFTHRREPVLIPPGAASFWIVVSSAGPPATFGIYGFKGIAASERFDDGQQVPIDLSFPHTGLTGERHGPPPGWVRDGSRRSMAKLVEVGGSSPVAVLTIEDDDATAHAEWHTAKNAAPRLGAAEALTLEWDEAFSIGISDTVQSTYTGLSPGRYTLRVQRTDMLGMPIGDELRCFLIVRPPFWQSSWFWIALAFVLSGGLIGTSRYWDRRRLQREIARFKQERALDRERLRIAQDIHDDLGARVTHISLLSAMGGQKASNLEQARTTFEQISQLTQDLVFALYQTVWAVDPENDSLDALVDHLCQIASKQCAPSNIRCRLHVDRFPSQMPVSSEARHNISMCVSEAVHNAVKHSDADEISLTVRILDSVLEVTVRDNGSGLPREQTQPGHGLANMRHRMERIGSEVVLAPSEDHGTSVSFSVPLCRLLTVGSQNDRENV